MVIFNCGFLDSGSQIYVEEARGEINRISRQKMKISLSLLLRIPLWI